MAQSGRYSFPDEDVRRIEALLLSADMRPDDRSRLYFAIGNLFDKQGRWTEAFSNYESGNQLRKEIEARRGVVFDPEAHRHEVDQIIRFFTKDYFTRVASHGVDSELPVFIVGMPRSGTTLAEQILASHSKVFGAGELQNIPLLIHRLGQRLRSRPFIYPQSLQAFNAHITSAVAADYLKELRRLDANAARIVDKMPFNFLHLGLIATLFPKARIIHCRRDPIDTCLSCYFQNFGNPAPFTLDLRHLGLYFREYERLMAHWAAVLPMPIFDLRYENLIDDQETVSRELIAFCGLEWEPQCLRFHETNRPVRTASVAQVKQPVYRRSIGRWQRYEAHLRPLFEVLAGLSFGEPGA